ncbi:hypothetical protein MFRU_007g00970 [Monilinia fructicola]|nr:hypothetical protein MFRU_007g00970 [Monilinia fructicola]
MYILYWDGKKRDGRKLERQPPENYVLFEDRGRVASQGAALYGYQILRTEARTTEKLAAEKMRKRARELGFASLHGAIFNR